MEYILTILLLIIIGWLISQAYDNYRAIRTLDKWQKEIVQWLVWRDLTKAWGEPEPYLPEDIKEFAEKEFPRG